MAQLAQSLRFDLADTFASYREVLADFFQRMLRTGRPKSKTHLDHFLFARRERRQNLIRDLAQVRSNHRISRIQDRLVFDEIAEM